MDFAMILEFISTLGFPVACVVAMAAFIFHIYKQTTADNAANMEKVQQRCKEREDKLYTQLEKQNEINGRFAEIIAQYEIKLDNIQTDINDIKSVVMKH